MTAIHHAIIGMPQSGKTTFLAALWHLLDAGEVESEFILEKMVGDHSYLNTIVAAWRKCTKVPRTPMLGEKKISMHVRHVSTDQEVILHFPDLSGESFEKQLVGRSCAPDYLDDLNGEGGILLFVTADKAEDGISITDLNFLSDEGELPANATPNLAGDVIAPNGQPSEEEITQAPRPEWNHKMVPNQVNIVELLQFIAHSPFKARSRKVGIIISAWDVVNDGNLLPSDWVKREMPLLAQFLSNNTEKYTTRVYGVSAQGGDLSKESIEKLSEKIPSQRISCISSDVSNHDITSPISWLMSIE